MRKDENGYYLKERVNKRDRSKWYGVQYLKKTGKWQGVVRLNDVNKTYRSEPLPTAEEAAKYVKSIIEGVGRDYFNPGMDYYKTKIKERDGLYYSVNKKPGAVSDFYCVSYGRGKWQVTLTPYRQKTRHCTAETELEAARKVAEWINEIGLENMFAPRKRATFKFLGDNEIKKGLEKFKKDSFSSKLECLRCSADLCNGTERCPKCGSYAFQRINVYNPDTGVLDVGADNQAACCGQ